MADQTVIDQFVVKIGLDPSDFKKGDKEVRQATEQTKESIKKSSGEAGEAFTAFGRKFVGWAALIGAAYKTIQWGGRTMSDLSKDIRQLGIDSANLGVAADELKNFQNVSEMMGGSAKELTDSVAGLQKAVYDLAFNGQMSESLTKLARLGVRFQEAGRGARDFGEIVLDTQGKIQGLMSSGTMSRSEANFFLRDAGFDAGTTQAILSGNVQQLLAQQQARRQVTGEHLGAATTWEQSATSRDQAIQAGALGALPGYAAKGAALNRTIEGAANLVTGQTDMDDFFRSMLQMSRAANEGLDAAGETLSEAGSKLSNAADALLRSVQGGLQGLTRGMRNNNPGGVKAVGDQKRDLDGFRIFDTMEEGVIEASKQLDRYAEKGIDTIDEIVDTWAPASDGNDTEAYKKHLESVVGVGRGRVLTESDRALLLSGMFRHESGGGAPDSGGVADILQAQPTPGSARNQGSAPNVTTIGEVKVYTQATDAAGIARDLGSELQRKSMAAHAERGLR